VLGEDARVLHRHGEARELDDARAEGAVALEEWRPAQARLRAGGVGAQAAAALEPESEPPELEPDPESLFGELSEAGFASGFESPSFFEPFFDEE
jgi:hypothetical protein